MQPTFDEFIGLVDQPMLVVTTTARQRHAGCLVCFHSQCSIEPPLYAVWLSKANRTFRIAVHAEVFTLHFLEESDHDLAELFGTHTGDDEDKFTQCTWAPVSSPEVSDRTDSGIKTVSRYSRP
jgi:flavin reductase (DIM6/NTAB) family NADH-FMN oxidoreductase RutF